MSNEHARPHAAITFTVQQSIEQPVKVTHRQNYSYRFAYVRSLDARRQDTIGEDYLAIRELGDRVAFALCDGVGQSFKGDLGARLLGDGLIEWLSTGVPWQHDAQVRESLLHRLYLLAEQATQAVANAPYSPGLPQRVVKALDQKRSLGTESKFVAGLLDFRTERLLLVWLGDAQLKVWRANDEPEPLGDTFLSDEGWSSRKGAIGQPHVRMLSLGVVHRIVAHSDGLNVVSDRLQPSPTNSELTRLINAAHTGAGSDDISFFELLQEPFAWQKDDSSPTREIAPLPLSVTGPSMPNEQPPQQPPPKISPPNYNPPKYQPSPKVAPKSESFISPQLFYAGSLLLILFAAIVLLVRLISREEQTSANLPAITIEQAILSDEEDRAIMLVGRTATIPAAMQLNYILVGLPGGGPLGAGAVRVQSQENGTGRFETRLRLTAGQPEQVVRVILLELAADGQTILSVSSQDIQLEVSREREGASLIVSDRG